MTAPEWLEKVMKIGLSASVLANLSLSNISLSSISVSKKAKTTVDGLILALLVSLCGVAGVAHTANSIDVYQFENEEQRQRYKALIDEFRCPKCINTNLSGSDAPIAQDLRRTVHRLVVQEGYSDQDVRDFLQARYGDFVLYDPPFNERTWLIWVVPLAVLFIGVVVLVMLRRPAQDVDQLSEQDQAAAAQLLAGAQAGPSASPSPRPTPGQSEPPSAGESDRA